MNDENTYILTGATSGLYREKLTIEESPEDIINFVQRRLEHVTDYIEVEIRDAEQEVVETVSYQDFYDYYAPQILLARKVVKALAEATGNKLNDETKIEPMDCVDVGAFSDDK